MPQKSHVFRTRLSKAAKLDYLLHLPATSKKEKLPVILFLHGSGERGNDVRLVKKNGIPKIAAKDKAFPFIAISPQCPRFSHWVYHFDELMALVDSVIDEHNGDPTRLYLTGLSMGGNGVWGMAYRYPNRFAAIAPICGHDLFFSGVTENPSRIKHIPIWAFHGAADFGVPVGETAWLCNKLRKLGADIQFTVYPYASHDSWTEAYADPKLYQWLLSHRLATK